MDAYFPDHYRVLGVSPRADLKALKASYRKLSRVYHPDRQEGSATATSRFQLISAAYTTLTEPAERERYDRLLLLTDPLRFVDDPRADKALQILDGVVGRLRNRNKRLPARQRGRNIRVKAEVPFVAAAVGGPFAVQVQERVGCRSCDGAGTVLPDRNPGCHVCGGIGKVKVGVRRAERPCGFCDAKGFVLLAPCDRCDGAGELVQQREETVILPARCKSGATVRVRGRGERADTGADRGDLLVGVQVTPDPLFVQDGDDLVVPLPLRWSEAVEGVLLDVPTLHGPRKLRVPAGMAAGREIRIKGAGLPRARGGSGDLRYRIELDAPSELSGELMERLRALEAQLVTDDYPRRADFERRVANAGHPSIPANWSADERL